MKKRKGVWRRFRAWFFIKTDLLTRQAARYGFPWFKRNVYTYCCECWMGRFRYDKWRKLMSDSGIDLRETVPLQGSGTAVATYKLLCYYDRSIPGGDYGGAGGAYYGDFELLRIDHIGEL